MLSELTFAFVIVAVCAVIHTAGLFSLVEWLLKRRATLERQTARTQYLLLLFVVMAVILLHLAETAIWAASYRWWGLFSDFETALYFSLGSYTTIGYGDVVLPQRWRLLGALEGISGVLLCGLSTAFLFAIVNAFFQSRRRQ
jgi:hypothetical protein